MLEKLFRLSENRTTPGREFQAGCTTFAAMAYILAVNAGILSTTGMDKGALVTVTALSAALSTVLMALLTNYPLALAPGMGINAFFAFTICGAMGVPWQEALGMVFINGVAFLLLSVTGLRQRIIAALPQALKIGITCGIGLFIALIGLKNAGIIVGNPATLVSHGRFSDPAVALALAGIAAMAILVARRVPGAIVLTILGLTAVGTLVPAATGGTVTSLPPSAPDAGWWTRFISLPASIEPTAFKLSFGFLGSWESLSRAIPVILTLLLVDMFDNIGTLIGVTKRAGLLQPDGTLPRAGGALVADSVATILGSLLGTSTVVSYIESASGVEAGGRTGLTSVTTAALLLLALFFTPLILAIPAAATAPALVIVGIFMMQSIGEVDMRDFPTAAPVVLTLLAIPLTFSIAEGIGLGLLGAALLSLGRGTPRALTALGYALAAVFFLRFFELPPF